jgi:hypothetical protein
MATYVNNLRLKEITTGDEDGTWGTSTNTNLELITDGFSYGTKQMSADANETFTMPDATADATRGFYLKITSASSLTGTRVVTLGPNTVSKVWLVENATTGSQIITIKQGSGGSVDIANGSKFMVITDGAGAGAAVINANPTETGVGDVTLNGVQTLTNKTLTSPVLGGTTTSASGNIVLSPATQIVEVKGNGSSVEGQIKLNCHANTHGQTLKAQPHSATVTNTMLLPLGANSTLVSEVGAATLTNKTINGSGNTITNVSLTAGVTGTLPIANGGTNATTVNAARQSIALPATADVHTSTPATLVDGQYCVAAAGSITFTLPASPAVGDSVIIKDGTGAAATTSFTVARNGSKIASSATDLTFDKNFAEITLTYIDGTIGWSV